MTEEWWPELGPKWEPTTADRPSTRTIDAHTHLIDDKSGAFAKPFFEPEMDPRSFFSPEESVRYNRELRSQPHIVAKFRDPEVRLADMDKQGIDM